MSNERTLVARQNNIWQRMQEIQRAADEAGEWTQEQRDNWDAAERDLTAVSGDIERVQRAASYDEPDYTPTIPAPAAAPAPEDRATARETAFGKYLRFGMDDLSVEQRQLVRESRAATDPQATTPDAVGGYLIPKGYLQRMTEALKAFGGLYNLAEVMQTATGQPIEWPTHDGTSSKGIILGENQQITVDQATWGTKTMKAFKYSSNAVLVSLELLQDSVFDLDSLLPRYLGERLARIQADHYITGNGTTQPEGILTNATAGVTAASAAALTYDHMIGLEHSIDPAYRAGGNCRFLFNDATLSTIRKIRDDIGGAGLGRPLWLPVPVPGQPATINGIPYTIDQSMPNIGTGNKSVAFGDFRRAYIVREVMDMRLFRLAERYADYGQVGFFAFMRLDAKVNDSRAYRVFSNA